MDIDLYTQLLDEIRQKVGRGVAPNCFTKHALEEQANLGMTDLELAYAVSTPFGAGVETVMHFIRALNCSFITRNIQLTTVL